MRNTPANLIVPYLDIEVPVLYDDEGSPYVPAVFFSRLLGLDHSHEMRRVQHIMLRYEMRCFFVQQPLHRRVWTFPYPFGLAAWLGNVYEHVKDEAWKAKLMPFIKWGMKLWGQAFQKIQQQFIQTRREMYDLASTIAGMDPHVQHIQEIAHRYSPEQQARIQHIVTQWRHLSEQAGAFIQRWLADKNALPVVQAFVVKDDAVDPDSPSMTLFATASQEDIDILHGHVRAINQWFHELKDLLDELNAQTDKE